MPGWPRFLAATAFAKHSLGLYFAFGLATEGGHSLASEAVVSAVGRSGNCGFGQEIRSRNEAFDCKRTTIPSLAKFLNFG